MKRIVIPVVLSVGLLTGCDSIRKMAEGSISEQDQQQLEAYRAEIASLESEIALVESQAEAQTKAAYEDARKGLTQNMGIRIGQLIELQERHEELVGSYTAAVEGERKIMTGGTQKAIDGVLGWLGPLVPAPAQPLIPFASSLAVMLFSSRARKHTGKALKATMKGSLGEAAALVLKAVGASHSSNDPAEIVGGALKMAKQQGADSEKLAKLEEVKSELEA
jgi:outer membrane murein-binding lipoprotein Lpp